MRTVTAARKIVLAHLSTLPLSFDPTAHVERESNKKMLNWAARIKKEPLPFPNLETCTGNGSATVSMTQ